MGKLIILVAVISIIPLVEALTIFGEEVSLLILIPLILIFIFLISFVFVIIKDKIKSKSINLNTKLTNLPEFLPIETLAAEPLLIQPTQTKLISEPIQTQKSETDYLKETEELERKLPSISIKDANKKINELIKSFFSDYTGTDYNFTFEELENELKKRNKKIRCFANNLSLINYSPEGLSRENLIELIRELKDIIQSDVAENPPITPEFKKEIEEKKKKINILLKKGEKLIGKDIDKARENYQRISELYETLTDTEKEIIRPSIIDFYNHLGF